ncbi:branched-chain amino acid transport system II carrier protein [Erysipelothrix urinaevulpis]|uniref:branched-chain amino acid transport system II carrier protein n=1 Tax=Erysipelothrix urinaevulpis TaxID=2683717 RepID=UPI00135A07F8|nr:branched-chain amino acid transport system II carrier protein [Erysipelothrix urinaevulpis]
MKKTSLIKERLKRTSLLCGLFFGAGNLIFPVAIGQQSNSLMPFASLGFILSAVGLASFGVIATAHSNKNSLEGMLEPYGKKYARFFTMLLMLTIGPLFALPRTATVPYEVTLPTLLPMINHQVGLLIYSFIFFGAALLIALNPRKVEKWIALIINPLFLALLLIFIIVALVRPMGSISNLTPSQTYMTNPVLQGFKDGYQTMDLLAALSFGFVVYQTISGDQSSKNSPQKELIYASLFAGLFMSGLYICLAYIGATSLNNLEVSKNGGLALGQIFNFYFGRPGLLFFAIIITLACLKTAIGLITSCSAYFISVLGKKEYRKMVLFITGLGFLISNFGLNTIVSLSIPILNFIYPLAIFHSIIAVFFKRLLNSKHSLIILTCLVATCSFLDLLISSSIISQTFMTLYYRFIPFARYGFAWVSPVILAGLIQWFLAKKQFKIFIKDDNIERDRRLNNEK